MDPRPVSLSDAHLFCLFAMMQLRSCRKKLSCFRNQSRNRLKLVQLINQIWSLLPSEEYCRVGTRKRLSFCLFVAENYPDWLTDPQPVDRSKSLGEPSSVLGPLGQIYDWAECGDNFFPFVQEEWQQWQEDNPHIISDHLAIIKRLLSKKTPHLSRTAWQFCLWELNTHEKNSLSAPILKLLACGCHSVTLRPNKDAIMSLCVRFVHRGPLFTFLPAAD